jgi:hypothetical protein
VPVYGQRHRLAPSRSRTRSPGTYIPRIRAGQPNGAPDPATALVPGSGRRPLPPGWSGFQAGWSARWTACLARPRPYGGPRVAIAVLSSSPRSSRLSASAGSSVAALIAAIRLPSAASSGVATANASANVTPRLNASRRDLGGARRGKTGRRGPRTRSGTPEYCRRSQASRPWGTKIVRVRIYASDQCPPAGFEPAHTPPERVAVHAPGLRKRARRGLARARLGRSPPRQGCRACLSGGGGPAVPGRSPLRVSAGRGG